MLGLLHPVSFFLVIILYISVFPQNRKNPQNTNETQQVAMQTVFSDSRKYFMQLNLIL